MVSKILSKPGKTKQRVKAAILVQQKKPLVVAEIELPEMAYGQVLVKIMCSGICGSQLREIEGGAGTGRFLPHLIGHEGAGVVIETGPGVTKVTKGVHVVLHWHRGEGIESPVPQYKWEDTTINAGRVTTLNEYAVVSENRLTPMPSNIEFEIGALMGCSVTTGFGVINNDARLKIGESIAVFGSGGLGLNEIQGASMVSAYPIIAVDLYDHKLNLARKFGATHILNSRKCDPRKEILKITGSRGVDVAVDNTGNVKVIETACECTASSGKTILAGTPPHSSHISIHALALQSGKIIKGSQGGDSNPSVDIPRYLNLYNNGAFTLTRMITHRFFLEEINEAIETMRSGQALKCIVKMVH